MSLVVDLRIALPVLAALSLSWAAVAVSRSLAPRLGFVDVPNQRSSHMLPTPRAGGMGIVASVGIVLLTTVMIAGISMSEEYWLMLGSGLLVAAVSLLDDRWRLPARIRFGTHLLSALVLVLGGTSLVDVQWNEYWILSLGWMSVPVSVLWIVGLTNIYNFMDGIDGIAASQGVVVAVAAAWIASLRGDSSLFIFLIILAAATLGFLAHNWPPAMIFMGDVGSAFLGFTFAGLALVVGGASSGSVPFLAWVILLAPFLFDSGITLIRRMLRGERWYEAHKEHLYQRLVRAGWSHLAVTCLYLAMDLFLAVMVVAHFGYGIGSLAMIMAASSVPLAGLVVLVGRVEARPSLVTRG